jgi:hypothetical protein
MKHRALMRMIKEAGGRQSNHPEKWDIWEFNNDAVERFAKLVAADEREACAKLAQETVCDKHIPTGYEIYGTKVAAAIRARGTE